MSASGCWPKRAELLVCGYDRQNYKHSIPMVINNLVKRIYDDCFYWKIQNDEMKQFLLCKNGDIIHSKSFAIKGIEFECTLCPNGWKKKKKGFVEFFLETKSIPINVEIVAPKRK